jgi:hypothetical protein
MPSSLNPIPQYLLDDVSFTGFLGLSLKMLTVCLIQKISHCTANPRETYIPSSAIVHMVKKDFERTVIEVRGSRRSDEQAETRFAKDETAAVTGEFQMPRLRDDLLFDQGVWKIRYDSG